MINLPGDSPQQNNGPTTVILYNSHHFTTVAYLEQIKALGLEDERLSELTEVILGGAACI